MTHCGHPRRHLARQLALVVGLLLAACSGESATPAPASTAPEGDRRPDLLLVVVDTLRADHLSTYGYHRPTSPVMDAIGGEGIVCEDVLAQSSWTQPSMVSMLIGRNLFENANRLPGSVPSLAERLRAAGYETAAFVGNPAVSRTGDYDRGFDHFISRADTGGQNWTAGDLEAAVRDWYAAHPPGDAPRLYYLHFLDPHYPYTPPADVELPGRVRLDDDVLEAWMREIDGDATLTAAFDADRHEILEQIDAYDREIVVTDAAIGRLRELLGTREHGVVIAADHGECLWERRHHELAMRSMLEHQQRDPQSATLVDRFFRDHSYHMFREFLFTPLIATGPGLPAGARLETPVANVDIAPTLLRMAGLPDDPELDGRPLQDLLSGAAAPREALFAHSKEATVVRQLADGKKLIFPTDTGFHFGMPIMLFDLDDDPDERVNLWEQDLDDMRALTGRHSRALQAFDLYDGETVTATDAELSRQMRELGYAGAGFDEFDAAAGPGSGASGDGDASQVPSADGARDDHRDEGR